jgi:hypothetical protein
MLKITGAPLVFMLLGACSASEKLFSPTQLQFTTANVVVSPQPTRFETVITITNPTDRTISLKPGCGQELRVFATPDYSGDPVWSSLELNAECSPLAIQWTLPSKASMEYKLFGSAVQILGDSRVDGIYYVDATIQLNQSPVYIRAGPIELRK